MYKLDEEVKNLENDNFIHVYGVANQIHKELNLTKDRHVSLDLFSAYPNITKALGADKITKGEVQVIKRKVLKYLKELGVVVSWQESPGLPAVNTVNAAVLLNRPYFEKLYPLLKQRALHDVINETKQLLEKKESSRGGFSGQSNIVPTVYEITFKEGIIFLNGIYLTKPQYGSINYDFFDFVYKHPNQRHDSKELLSTINSSTKKTVHQILSDLKFKGELKKVFFEASSSAVTFYNPITAEMIKAKSVDYLNLVEIGRNLVENSKKE